MDLDWSYTDEVRLRAAVVWAGKDAVTHGVSAAWWHDLDPELPATVEVTVRRGRNPSTQAGVVIRRRNVPYRISSRCATCGSLTCR